MPKHLDQLRSIIDAGSQELGFTLHDRPEGPPVSTHKRAATAGSINLRDVMLTAGADVLRNFHPNQVPAGKLIPLSASIAERSRVAQAGAVIMIVPEAAEAVPLGKTGGIALVSRPHRFDTVEAAPFAPVPEPVFPAQPDLPESPAPISRALVNFAGPSHGFRCRVSRRDMSLYGADNVLEQLLQAITWGLARAADQALLTAIVAGAPAAFSLGSAAAVGLEFAELRALVGTNAAAAQVGQDGTLRAAGVPAELTPAIAATVVGSFTRAAVAVHDSLRVAVERRNAAGDMVVTCWADFQALLPDISRFWTAA